MKGFVTIALTILCMSASVAQDIFRVEPPSWWVGMKNPNLQLMVYGAEVAQITGVDVDYPGVEFRSVQRVQNSNYLFINLTILESALPGALPLVFRLTNKESVTVSYPLLERREGSSQRKGFDSSDVVYLVFPDRFANGDPGNDTYEGMTDKLNRKDLYARHGGDIQGIINHLDYFKDLGVTALWVNPVLESNQPWQSYHHYAITDFYRVDRRLGDNNLYCELVDKAHDMGLKVIKDMVFNHCGGNHPWIADLPSDDWLNQWPQFTRSNYRIPAIFDPHASELDRKLMSDGWFDNHMPDLNQRNPFLANYLTQNSIWWVEYANLDGIRMDTHPYADKEFMAGWTHAVMEEYPNFNIVAETWVNYPAWVAYWQKGALNRDGFDSGIPTVMDFPLCYAINKAFDEGPGWDTGLHRLYEILAHDYLYANPNNIFIFADNHDVSRFMSSKRMRIDRFKLGMAFLLTTRGIPQIYYGTEILMDGHDSKGHGVLRKEFPGGWPDHKRNAFHPEGRTAKQNEAWDYLSNLLEWRKSASAVHGGSLTHFIPEDEVYVYFRSNEQQTVMVVLHNGKKAKMLSTHRFNEILKNYSSGVDIITRKTLNDLDSIRLAPRSAMIIELR